MSNSITEKIKIWGIVQGVGFRPFVAKIARRIDMKGYVRNTGGLVEIVVTDEKERIDRFIEAVKKEKPLPSEIVHIKREIVSSEEFADFIIKDSGDGGQREVVMIPGDLAICPECLREMRDEKDGRYAHPFISCMICGPRYTIIDRVPYDRDNTAMIDFPMCAGCNKEYTGITDRRYHAQTISCHSCGPYLKYVLQNGEKGGDERNDGYEILRLACSLLKEGKVIALKNIGGYNLMADPFSRTGAEALRLIKNRDEKPFALLFGSQEEIEEYCFIDSVEKELIVSSARPIVLLEHRGETIPGERDLREIEKSRFIGSFLPSTGAQYILLDMYDGPLISTSANLSDMPMIKDEEEMFALMKREPLLSGVFYNDRDIRVRVDDSVVRVIDSQPQIIRRSKGYAPVPLYISGAEGSPKIFAAGGQLKNSFALTKGPFAYMSQYFGDLDTEESREIYQYNMERMGELFRIRPEVVACDMHPLYYTTAFARAYAKANKLKITEVQHHHAHIASVMAEHDLEGDVIGVAFDGTGYGIDGAIWGGEILLCNEGGFVRLSHLKYVKMLGGDASVKDGWKSALSYIYAVEHGYMDNVCDDELTVDVEPLMTYAQEHRVLSGRTEYDIALKALRNDINIIESSSMGRLFDAVAAMLDINMVNKYEGESAIMLEDCAYRALKNEKPSEREKLALDFHYAIAAMTAERCFETSKMYGTKKVALSGGVFQNKILMERILFLLREKGLEPYYNISVSPNDGGIALGQAYVACKRAEKG